MKQVKANSGIFFPGCRTLLLILVSLSGMTLLSALGSCSGEKTGDAGTRSDTTESSTPSAEGVRGTWTIRKYYFGEISAMDDKTASEWLDKKLVIDDKLHFDFSLVRSYASDYKNLGECDLPTIDSPEEIPASDYFDPSRGLYTDLDLENTQIRVYRSSCTEHPFSEFILTQKNELIFYWDGAFFLLSKEGAKI